MSTTSVRPVEILLVEDSPSDARLTIETLKDGRLLNSVHHVTNGEEAVAFLRRESQYQDAPRPDIVLLDINLPRKSGLEVLGEVKADPDLRSIPVVILSTSNHEKDVLSAYGLNANCYITKPVDLEKFIEVVKSVDHFWVNIVALPPKP